METKILIKNPERKKIELNVKSSVSNEPIIGGELNGKHFTQFWFHTAKKHTVDAGNALISEEQLSKLKGLVKAEENPVFTFTLNNKTQRKYTGIVESIKKTNGKIEINLREI